MDGDAPNRPATVGSVVTVPRPGGSVGSAEDQVRVRLLGHPEVRVGDEVVDALGAARLQSLLGYLIVHREAAQPRQRLAFLFWPDSAESQARTNLRQALHNLRRALPDSDRFLRSTGQTVQWRPDAPARIDVVEFEDAVACAASAGTVEALADAVAVYGGDLLPGCYDDWVEPERRRLTALHVAALNQLATAAEARGDHAAAARFAERLLAADRLDEGAYRRLMRVHVLAGQRAHALRTYHDCVTTLQRELGVSPSSETVGVYEDLVAEGGELRQPPVARPPLCGREREQAALRTRWEAAARGHAHLVLVSGEAGIGKSRLVEDVRAWCSRRGVATAWSRAYEAEGGLPYAPVVDLLRSTAVRPVLDRLGPVWVRELARVLPELAAGQHRPGIVGRSSHGDRTPLFEAVARAITGVGRPLLLVVDDLQWADTESLELLHYLLRFAAGTPVLVVGTVRPDEIHPRHPVTTLVTGLRTIDAVHEITLDRLDDTAARALAAELSDADSRSLEWLVTTAGGNPLFLVELAHSGLVPPTPGGAVRVPDLPPRVRSVIESRLAKVPDQAREVAAVAAVVGRPFTVGLLTAALAHRTDEDVVSAIDELWRRGLVRPHGVDAYDFDHDVVRDVAYSVVAPARRRRLHLAVAGALEELHADAVDGVAAQVATHYDRAGALDRAVTSYRRAVEVAGKVYAHEDMAALARRGLQLVSAEAPSPERDERELSFLVPLGVALHAGRGLMDAQTTDVHERATALRAALGLPPEPSTLRLSANQAIGQRRYPAAQHHGELLLALAEQSGDSVLLTEAHYLLGVSSFWLGHFPRSHRHLTAALAAYRPDRAAEHVEQFGQDPLPICLVRLAWTTWHLGRAEDAVELRHRALRHAGEVRHPYTRGYTRVFAGWMAVDMGDPDVLPPLADDRRAAASEHRFLAAMTTLLEGWSAVLRGSTGAGVEQLEEGLEAARAGHLVIEPLGLMLLARAHSAAGEAGRALTSAAAASLIAARDMPFHESDAFRLHGEALTAAGGRPADIQAAFRRAAVVAERQGSVPYELRARAALVQWLRSTANPDAAREEQVLEALRQLQAKPVESR